MKKYFFRINCKKAINHEYQINLPIGSAVMSFQVKMIIIDVKRISQ
ncbi:hypothetical protein EM595_1845 [Duffyella gerundensis]|uniref:Uncharacterized protein n=1 Tax=Duffyella gerundensis TaxID=1619313 RepID=A0A0U5L2J2_9GAMM|nr:hypothetical protein EM595_1845 [Duffyella gerundensis]